MQPRLTRPITTGNPVNPWIVVGVIALGNICSGLMSSGVNVILPTIRAELGLTMSAVEWVVTGYMLVLASLLVFYGRLGDILGHKRIYVLGISIFTIGSLACGLSPTIEYLLISRVVQAIGAGMLWAVSVALITDAFPATKRGRALGLYSSSACVGLSLGPTFGGFMVGWLGWHSVFFTLTGIGLIWLVL